MYQSDSQNTESTSQRPAVQSSYASSEPSVQHIKTSLHRPLSSVQQQFIQKTLENPDRKQDDVYNFIRNIGKYSPTIPDSVSSHFLTSCGVDSADARVTRLIALAAQKHISDIILDSMQNARMKGLGQTKKGTKETKFVLTEDLLDNVLSEYGIQNTRPPYQA